MISFITILIALIAIRVHAYRITTNEGISEHVDQATFSSNFTYYTWHDNTTGTYLIYLAKGYYNATLGNYSVLDNGTNITGNTSMYPKLVIDVGGTLHLVFQDNRNDNWEIYYMKIDPDTYAIQNETRLTNTPGASLHPDIACDSRRDCYVVWQDNSSGYFELYYKKLVYANPDFTVTSFYTEEPTFNSELIVYVNVTNLGSVSASNVRISTFRNDREVMPYYADLDALETVTFNYTISNLTEGANIFRFYVDKYNYWIESNETNNEIITAINMLPNDNWPVFMQNHAHEGISSSDIPLSSNLIWIYNLSSDDGKIYSSILAYENKVYAFAYHEEENVSKVLSIYQENGTSAWNFSVSQQITSTPAISNGLLYIASRFVNDTNNDTTLYCINSTTGELQWNITLTLGSNETMYSAPVPANDMIFLATGGGILYGLDYNESVKWTAQLDGIIYSTPAVFDTRVYISVNRGSDSLLYCLDYETGEIIWNYTESDSVSYSSPSIDHSLNNVNGIFFITNSTNIVEQGKVIKFFANGTLAWSKYFGREIFSSVVIDESNVYVGLADGEAICLNKTNSSYCWEGQAITSAPLTSTIVLDDNSLAVTGAITFVFNKSNGVQLWNYSTNTITGLFDPSPALANSKLFVAGESTFGSIYAFYTNSAPIITAIAQIEANETDVITINVTATDPNGDELYYYISSENFTIDNNIFRWQTNHGDAGNRTFTINVSDGSLVSEINVTVIVAEKQVEINISLVYPIGGENLHGTLSPVIAYTTGEYNLIQNVTFVYSNGTHNYTVSSISENKYRGVHNYMWNTSLVPAGFWTVIASAYGSNGTLLGTSQSAIPFAFFAYGAPPKINNFGLAFGSTNLSNPFINVKNVTNLTLANSYGKIKFPANYGIDAEDQDYDSYVRIGSKFISVDSVNLDTTFNNSVNLTFNNVECPTSIYFAEGTFNSDEEIIALNHVCTSGTNPSCTNINCVNNTVTFTASHFSGYAAGTSALTIWDETDSSMPFADQTKYALEQVRFFANYTNASVAIQNANCSINFSDSSGFMAWNTTTSLYEFNRSFGSASTYNWNATCNKSDYDTLTAADTVVINATSDVVAPIIINVTNSSITNESALISWMTNENANSSVKYGTNVNLTTGANSSASFSTSHSLTLNNLQNYTLYYYNVTSCDSSNNCNQTGPFNFTTLAYTPSDTTKPLFSNNVTGGLLQRFTNFTANVTVSDSGGLDYVWIESNHTGIYSNYSYTYTNGIVSYQFNNSFNISIYNSSLVCWRAWANDTSQNINSSSYNCFIVQNASQDSISPSIFAVSNASITNQSVLITWSTNENSNSSVKYGTNINLTTGTNGSATLTTSHNLTINNLQNSTLYYYNVTSCDSSNNCNTTGLYNFTTLSYTPDNTFPTVSLNSPINNYNSSSIAITFNCTASDNIKIQNVSLYTNYTGAWSINASNATGINGTPYIFLNNFGDGRYVWNCYACDNSTNCAIASNNYTLTIDTLVPLILSLSNSSITNQSVIISWTTNEYSNSTVRYGINIDLSSGINVSATLTTSHNLNIINLVNNTMYYYNVTSCDFVGNCNTTGPNNFTTLQNNDTSPPVFSSIANTSITNISVIITWTTNENANSSVKHGLTTNLTSGMNSSALFETSHSLTLINLTNNTLYYYNITSCDSFGNCNSTGAYNFTTLQNPDIIAPYISSITNASTTNQSTLITWSTNEIANSTVRYGTSSATLNLMNTSNSYVTSHSITLNNLTNNTLYYYNITSCDNSSNCNTTGPYSFTTQQNPDIIPPLLSSISNASTTNQSTLITWTTNENANSSVKYGMNSTNMSIGNSSGSFSTSQSLTLNNLQNNTLYYYNVTSCDASNNCNQTGPYNFTTLAFIPPDIVAPLITNVTNQSTTNQSTLITWTTNENANSTVRYGTSSTSLNLINSSNSYITSHSLSLLNLTNNTLYYYNITSCDNSSNCNITGPFNFTTLQNPDTIAPYITSVTNASTTNQSTLITWSTNENANSSVKYGTISTSMNVGNSSGSFSTSQSLTLNSLQNNTLYYYNVTSCDSSNNCNQTGPYNFTTSVYVPTDNTAPFIFNVTNVSITNQSVVINWSTNENANSSVKYGTNINLATGTNGSTALTTSHSRTSIGLQNNTIYYYNITSCDSSNNCNQTGPYNFTTLNNAIADVISPTLTLNSPIAGYNSSSSIVVFNCSAFDNVNLSNVSFYTNISGSWSVNETNSSGINGTTYLFNRSLADGTYLWNCYACDNSSNCAWGTNRSLIVDTVSPTVSLNLPSAGYANGSTTPLTIFFNCSASDSTLLVNISLLITNQTTSNYRINQTRNVSNTNVSSLFNLSLFNGNYTWNCLACDSTQHCSYASSNRTIRIAYEVPVISLVDQSTDEDVQPSLVDLFSYVSDSIDGDSSLTYTVLSQTNSTIINCSLVSSRYLNCTPRSNAYGYSNITVRVTDTSSLSANDTFKFTVTSVNDAPTISGVPIQNGVEDIPFALNVTQYLRDNETSIANLVIMENSQYATVSGQNITFTYPNNIASENVTITVSDGQMTGSQTILVTITAVNDAPTVPVINVTSSNSPPQLTDTFMCWIITPSSDVDNASIYYNYTWLVNNNVNISSRNALLNNSFTAALIGSPNITCRVYATDGINSSSSVSAQIQIGNIAPTPPSVDILPNVAFTNNSLICNITQNSTDANSDTIYYLFDWYKNGILQNLLNQTTSLTQVTLNAANTTAGETWSCSVKATDYKSYSSSSSDSVIISNAKPVILSTYPAGTNATIAENQNITFNVTYNDIDGNNTVSVVWTNGVSLIPTLVYTYIADSSSAGTYTIYVTVSDGSLSASKTFTLTVFDVNNIPQITSIQNLSCSENQVCSLDVDATDADTDNTLRYYDNTTMFAIDSLTGLISFTAPSVNATTNYSIKITVSDGQSAVNQSIIVTILNVNNAPILEPIGTLIAIENISFIYKVQASDADGDSINYSDNASLFNITSAGDISFTPRNADVGNYSIRILVNDSSNASDYEDIIFRVLNVNDPPTVLRVYPSGTTASITEEQNLTFNISYSDPDGTTPNVLWRLNNGFVASDTGNYQFIGNYSSSGTYTINVTVHDGMYSSSLAWTLTVTNVNRVPYWTTTVASKTCWQGLACTIVVSASDYDGDTVLYFSNNSLFSIGRTTGIASFTPTNSQVGNYTLLIRAADGISSNTTTISLTVVNVNDGPVLMHIGSKTVIEGNTLSFTAVATDVDTGDSISYSLVNAPNGMSIGSTTGAVTWITNNHDSGTYEVRVIATDSYGASDYEDISITVINHNGCPKFMAYLHVPFQVYNRTEENITSFEINVTDNDGTTPSIQWYMRKYESENFTLQEGETLSTYNFRGNFSRGYSNAGRYVIRAIISDGDCTNSTEWNLTINRVLDADEDGIPNYRDNCLLIYNPGNDASLCTNNADGDSVENNNDFVAGDADNVDTNLEDLNLKIEDSDNLDQVITDTQSVSFVQNQYDNTTGEETELPLVDFDYNFSSNSVLNLQNISIRQETNTSTKTNVIINGLDLIDQDETKTVYFNKGTGYGDYVCVKDAEIWFISDISSSCTGSYETRVRCDGSSVSGTAEGANQTSISTVYTCTLSNNRYTVTGLYHTAIQESDDIYSSGEETPETQAPSGAGGGGAGGLAVARINNSKSRLWYKLLEGSEIVWNLGNFTITQLIIKVTQDSSNTKVTVTILDTKPDKVSAAEQVYRYMNISHINLNAGETSIQFRVPNSWLGNKDIVLSKFATKWNDLPTRFIRRDSVYSYYSAITSGLSYFAIRGREKQVIKPVENISQEVKITPAAIEQPPAPQPIKQEIKPRESEFSFVGIIIIFIVILVVLFTLGGLTHRPNIEKPKMDAPPEPTVVTEIKPVQDEVAQAKEELILFIKMELEHHRDIEYIKKILIAAGWDEKMVDGALTKIFKQSEPNKPY